ncbi:MAG: hypothetical protein HWE26_13695 [Alteromonadaceae bacterium]|nr:hypothetical protein [Alteromonadaceae bacterium]
MESAWLDYLRGRSVASGAIYWGHAARGAPPLRVVLRLINEPQARVASGAASLSRASVQADIFALDYPAAWAVRDAIKAAALSVSTDRPAMLRQVNVDGARDLSDLEKDGEFKVRLVLDLEIIFHTQNEG